MPDLDTTAPIEHLQKSNRRWKRLALSLLAALGLAVVLVLLGVVLTFRARHGTVVVTVSEPDVKVMIDGEEKVTIGSRKVGRIELVPGDHELAVKRDQEVLYTESFTLKNGGETLIAARWEPTRTVREVVQLRCADLLRRAQDTHEILREIMKEKVAGKAFQIKFYSMDRKLSELWGTLATYGLGTDPYLDNIRLPASGFGRPKPPSDFGIPGPYVEIGLPRLHERFLEASGVRGEAAEKLRSDFKKLVWDYRFPEVFPHQDYGDHNYQEYRFGKGLFTPQYQADLQTLDKWLTDLENVLAKVPGYFEKAP
jgi:hypothetical protein